MSDIDDRPPFPTGPCAHCGKKLRSSVGGVSHDDGRTWTHFHSDRRACREAFRTTPDAPADILDLGSGVLGAALMGYDQIRWPWWLRFLASDWFSGVKHEIIARVGGAVTQRERPVEVGEDA